MSQSTPFRQRPNLHLALRTFSGSPLQNDQPRAFSTPVQSSLPTPTGTPLGTTAYSPFRSAGLKPPTPLHRSLSPKIRRQGRWNANTGRHFRIKRTLRSKPAWLLLTVFMLIFWWFNGGRQELDEVKLSASGLGRELLRGMRMQDFQFYPASNPKILYTGRWSATPNRLRKDGTFPGVYFDLVLSNTTTLLLSLHNQISQDTDDRQNSSASAVPNPAHFSFRPISATGKAAAPVSLLARIDDEEYVLLPNSSSLVTVCAQSLDPNREHQIRIVAPMTDGSENAVLELEGIWLSKGGKLSRVPGSTLSEEFEDEDLLEAENDFVGERHRAGINNIEDQGVDLAYLSNSNDISEDAIEVNQERRKVLEIVTDSPGSVNAKQRGVRHGGAESLLSGVMGWEYLLGEMFGADHVGISVEGMCLIQDCIEGRGSPAGIGDVFFRSGPYGSDHFQHTWTFSTYVPDVLVLNIGSADDASFKEYQQDYDKSYFDLSSRFEATYISLVKGIRRLAYPKHPAIIHSERLGSPGIIPPNTPAAIPIFIMRPFRGQLEQATQNVVALLRADGDKSVFWLDTSGWLDPDPESGRDFYLDLDNNDIENENDDAGSSDPITHSSRYYRLTEQGNQRVAIFLHMHVCRYLAAEGEKCAFLPQEVYQGKVFDPDEANFNRYLENEKERRLREMFWDDDESADGVSDGEGEGEGEG